MSKQKSSVQLVGTDKKRKKEYTIKTDSYPNLPILHFNKKSNKCLMEFPSECNGFAISFTLTAVSDNIKFGAIISELYNNLTLDDLKTMKMNRQNYLEVKETDFIAACSYCFKDITSVIDLKKCGSDDCHYRSCSSDACVHVIEKIHYCKSCFTINQPKSNDTSDRIYNESNNDDCVTVFNNVVDDDIQSVANTLKSMGDTSLFNKLPDSQVNDSYLQVLPTEPLDSVMRNDANNELAKS